ncbi:MAG: hypothetical protein VYC62_05685 [Verrucomicrobiota bacterium]|nr:hypothetical protein [Verrucomicrobiota bacterium]
MRLYLLATFILGAMVGVTYLIGFFFPQLTNVDLGAIGGGFFIAWVASLIWFDYGIDFNTYKFKKRSKGK